MKFLLKQKMKQLLTGHFQIWFLHFLLYQPTAADEIKHHSPAETTDYITDGKEIANTFIPFESSYGHHLISKRQSNLNLINRNGLPYTSSGSCVSFSKFCLYPDQADASRLYNGTPYSSTAVCFVAQKSPPFNKAQRVLHFEEEILNVGKGFDLKENVFTAQVKGIYEFTFDGFTSGIGESLNVSLQLNGQVVANAWADHMNFLSDHLHVFHTPISIHSILKLNKGDRISLYNKQGSLYSDNIHHTQFTGLLLLQGDEGNNKNNKASVYFAVRKNAAYCNNNAVLPFEIVSLNVGEAFNMKEQIFLAPVSGIYEFTFKGYKTHLSSNTGVSLRLNGEPVAYALAVYIGYHDYRTPFFFSTMLKVEKGDRINLYIVKGCLYDDENSYTQFTGKLLVEFDGSDSQFQSGSLSSAPVFFNVQKNETLWFKSESIIPFELEVLNFGGAFNLKEGIFTVPRSGIYEFTFKGCRGNHGIKNVNIALRLNGKAVAYGWAENVPFNGFYAPFYVHSILKTVKGDRIDLYNLGEGSLFYEEHQIAQFTGKLLFPSG